MKKKKTWIEASCKANKKIFKINRKLNWAKYEEKITSERGANFYCILVATVQLKNQWEGKDVKELHFIQILI